MCAICARGGNLIFDTDVIIWAFRKNDSAEKLLINTEDILISAVSYMELLQGVLNKQELQKILKFLNVFDVQILDITPEITRRAMKYVEDYALSDSMELADALIAATAVENGESLCTANGKHYKCVPGLLLSVFKVDS